MTQTKITAHLVTSLIGNFNRQVDALHIRRDGFLNAIIKGEIPHLAEEMKGKKMSGKARRYVAGELKRLGTTQVNIVVDKETANALNEVVRGSNMVRDAFLNRLLILLRGSSVLIDYLDLPEYITGSAFQSILEPMPTSPMKAFEAVHAAPFFYLREACLEIHQTGLYLVDLPHKLIGLSCFLEDCWVPGTKANADQQKQADALLQELLDLETEAFSQPRG